MEVSKRAGRSLDTVPLKELATKRIPVSPSTWEEMSMLKKPGQSYDKLLKEMMVREQEFRLIEDLRRIEQRGSFIKLENIDD